MDSAKKELHPRVEFFFIIKASQSFGAEAAKENEIIFYGGVYVGENTLRGVSVEVSAESRHLRHRAKRILAKKVVQPLFWH